MTFSRRRRRRIVFFELDLKLILRREENTYNTYGTC